ncbi:hypothetical protein DWF00_07625 [Bosea caraganae]|uniref:Uncharacterized protein n=1 Tax=Bosea caraganae TaxID=2763117 RepID=A0A370L279_9HYPH|nr:hypothetical protein [Bosea caraganae]RDJ21080.1 hypothetical protein DWE98_22420 [Bosea caraganae]RDJ28579.1 hypothetical protein DWF00_07625 [Bosea caraganae]
MPLSKRARDDVRTTPMLDRTMRGRFGPAILKVAAIFGGAYAAIAIYGLPTLKYDYVYHGRHDIRVEMSCRYITFDGWKRVIPPVGVDRCPVIAFVRPSFVSFPF